MLRTDGLRKCAITCLNSVKSKRGARLGRFLDQAIILQNNCQECSTFEPTNHPILRIWHYYGPSPPPNSGQMLFSLVQKWSSHNTLIAPSLLLFFFGGGGRVSICKCSCFHELYLASWEYITERPFFLTVFFQDCGQFEDLILQYIHILCLPGPTLTIEGTCIQLSSGVRIFWSRSRSALLIGFPFTGKDTIWHLWDPKNRSNSNKNVYGSFP